MKVLIRKLAARLQRLSPLTLSASALCGLLTLGIIDYFTPATMSFVLFYMLVVVLVGWSAGKWHALFVATAASIIITTEEWFMRRGVPQAGWVALWNNSTYFVVFSIVGWLMAEVTRLTRHLGQLVEERTAQWKAEVEQHKATSSRLAEAVERFEQVISNITEVFWLSDVTKNQMAYISPGYERIWGRKCEELYREPRSWIAAVHPADREEVLRRAQTDQAAGNYDIEYRILRTDGAVRWIRDRAFPVRNPQGEVYRIAGIADDITERKQTREVLQTQAAILEHMAEGVVVTDEQGVIVQMNPAAERIWGYEHNDLLGQPARVFSALPEPEATAVLREVLAALQATGSWRGTFKDRRKDGAVITCEAVVSRLELQGRTLMLAVEQDVTGRVRAQEQLQMQARVLENMAEAVLMTDETGTIVLTNPALDALVGYERGELVGKPFHLLAGISLEAHNAVFQANLQQIRTRGASVGENLARRKDGSLVEVETRSSGVNIGGRFHLVVVGQDITLRKQAEEALRQSEETLRVFLDAVPEPALLLDREGTILASNETMAHRLSMPKGDLVGKCIFDLIPREAAESRKAKFDHVLRTREVVRFEDSRGGRHFLNLASPVLDTARNVTRVAIFAFDITERKRAEAALREAHDRLEQIVQQRTTELRAANEALRQSEARLRLALDASNAGTWSWDVTSDRSTWDQRSYELYGFPPQEPVSFETWAERVHPEDRQNLLGRVRTIMEPGKNDLWNEEFRILHPVKGERWLTGLGRVERDQAGRGVSMGGINLDITERKRAEEAQRTQLAQIGAIYQTASVGLCTLDVNLRYVRINERLAAMNGLPVAHHIGRTLREVVPHYAEGAEAVCRQVITTGQPVLNLEVNGMTDAVPGVIRTGVTHWVPLKEADGRVTGISVVVEDVTERKRAEEARREQLEYIETIYQNAPVGLCAFDANLRYTRINERLAAMNGLPAARHIGRTLREVVPHLADATEGVCRQVIATGQPVLNLETQGLTAAAPGEIRSWVSHLVPLKDAAGRVNGISVMVEEITERRRAERTQRAQLAQIEAIYQTAPIGLCLLDTDFRYQRINERLAAMNGLPVEAHLGRTVRETVPHLADGTEALCRQAAATGQPLLNVEMEGTTAAQPNVIRSWVTHWMPIQDAKGRVGGVNVLVEEITERKAMERALRESEQKYRRLHESMMDAFVSVAMSGEVTEFNPAYAALLGYTAEELRNLTYTDLTPEKWHATEARIVAEQILPRGYSDVYEKEYRGKDGTTFPVELRTFLIRDARGEPAGMWAIVRDITERKRAEEALREVYDKLEVRVEERTADLVAANAALRASEERYRALAESSPDAIFILDPESKVQYVNSTAAAMWQRAPEDLIGLTQQELFQPEVAQYHSKVVAEVFNTSKPARRDEPLALPGGERWIDVRFVPLLGETGKVTSVMGVCHDITERRRAERQLAEVLDLNQKMIAASAMGIAAYRASGECVFVNEAVARTVGGSVGVILQQNFRHLKSWQESELLRLADEVLSQGQVRRGEVITNSSFGKVIRLDCHLAPFISNGQPHLLLMTVDVTEQKHAESLLLAQRDLGISLSLTTDLNASLRRLLEIILQMGGVDSGGAYLLNPATGGMDLVAESGGSPRFVKAISHWAPDSPQMRIVLEGRPVFSLYRDLPIRHDEPRRREGLRAAAIVPLSHEGNIIGALALASHVADEIPRQTQVAIEAVASQAAGAIARIRAEEALRESERRLRAIVSNAPVLIFAVDQDGIIRFEDGLASKALGKTTHARVGRSIAEVFRDSPDILECSRRALRGEEFESVVEAGPVVFDCWYSPTRDKDGKPAGYIGVATNITDRHRLERQVLEISDREQARIGQDIHDGLCQHLVSLAFDANSLRRDLSARHRPEAKQARRIAEYLDQAITEARQLSRGLFPVRLAEVGLAHALQDLASSTSARFKMRCRFEGEGVAAIGELPVATHLYRIAQEAVANAVKHARASTVRIRLRVHPGQIELRVEDNGAGFSLTKRKIDAGLGIHIMDYRARAVGGMLQIGPRSRGGTVVSCCVPGPKG